MTSLPQATLEVLEKATDERIEDSN
jgi:hypothetical protein